MARDSVDLRDVSRLLVIGHLKKGGRRAEAETLASKVVRQPAKEAAYHLVHGGSPKRADARDLVDEVRSSLK
jgi:hypothetical protein